jgi:hypothetical protein
MMTNKVSVFSVSNRHVADSGEPPRIDGDTKGRYYGYFENEHGEQAVLTYDRQSGTGTLWMGDSSWENPIAVEDGVALGVVLNEAETLWLKACWLAATATAAI